MSALTCASLYSGGGGADLGLVAAGCTPLWAVERDPAVAACYRANLGDHVLVGDVAGLDPAALPRPDLLWVSEPCQQHSLARSRALPARDDGDLSAATGAVVRALRPPLLIAENVPGYRHSAAYRAFIATLHELGYMVDSQLVNCSDYGVPQSRVRLIVRARLGGCCRPYRRPCRVGAGTTRWPTCCPTARRRASPIGNWRGCRTPWPGRSSVRARNSAASAPA